MSTRKVTPRTSVDLIAEERATRSLLLGLTVPRRAVPGGGVGTVLAAALAEQLRKQLHGRFPLTETDPPVGQDEP